MEQCGPEIFKLLWWGRKLLLRAVSLSPSKLKLTEKQLRKSWV
jgi:hypothetical protein